MSETRKYAQTLTIAPELKVFIFGPATTELIKSELAHREKPITKGSKITLKLREMTFDFHVIEVIPDDSYLMFSSKFEIMRAGYFYKKIPDGAWWMY